jgi:hypothetical protein
MGGAHKKKGRLRCHKRPKSREETPKEGSDSGVGGSYRIPLAKTIAISGSIERKGSRTDTKVYGARPQGRALSQWVVEVPAWHDSPAFEAGRNDFVPVELYNPVARFPAVLMRTGSVTGATGR